MPFDLFGETQAEVEANRAQAREDRARLAHVETELELYRHESWKYMESRLKAIEKNCMEAMIGAGPDDLRFLQSRVLTARHLLGIQQSLEDERAQLLDRVGSTEEEE